MKPDADQVRSEVRATLFGLSSGATFGDDEDVFATGVVRSMNLIELITCLEDTYGLVISQGDVFDGHLRSVDRLVALVMREAA